MKLCFFTLTLIYFCINICNVLTVTDDLFDELWKTNNKSTAQPSIANETEIKIKVEPFDEQMDAGEWQQKNHQMSQEKADDIKEEKVSTSLEIQIEDIKKEQEIIDNVMPKNENGQNKFNRTPKLRNIIGEQQSSLNVQLCHNKCSITEKTGIYMAKKRLRDPNDGTQLMKMMKNAKTSDESPSSSSANEETEGTESGTQSDDDVSDQLEDGIDSGKFDGDCSRKKRILTPKKSDEEKIKIVKKFLRLKKQINESGDKRPHKEINKEIADKFDVSVRTIYGWKKKFGFTLKNHSKREKIAILKQYKKLKKEKKGIKEIERELQIGKSTLIRWRKEFRLEMERKEKIHSDEKRKIIKIFDKIMSKIPNPVSIEIQELIANKLGLKRRTILNWKKRLGLREPRKEYSKKEKLVILKRFVEMKSENPAMGSYQIFAKLKISSRSFYRWQKEFDFNLERKASSISDAQKRQIIQQLGAFKANNSEKSCEKEMERIAKELGISIRTIYYWKKKFGVICP